MTNRKKIYIALAASAFIAVIIAISAISAGHRDEKLRQAVETAKQNADKAESNARQLEQQAAEHKQKIEYLEDSLSALRLIAVKQDEELKQIENTTNTARDNVSSARAVRSLESTTAELCAKLAALGHPCE